MRFVLITIKHLTPWHCDFQYSSVHGTATTHCILISSKTPSINIYHLLHPLARLHQSRHQLFICAPRVSRRLWELYHYTLFCVSHDISVTRFDFPSQSYEIQKPFSLEWYVIALISWDYYKRPNSRNTSQLLVGETWTKFGEMISFTIFYPAKFHNCQSK